MMRKTLYLLLTLLFVFSKLPAQQYQLSTFNIYEGFSKGPVKDIEVDELGFIWMATDEGLIRFDGSESRLYKDELKGGFAKALYKTDDSVLYVVHDFGLTRINSFPDTTTFNTLLSGTLLDSDSTIFYPKFILADQDGVLWVGEAAAIVRFSDGRLHKYRFPAKAESDDFFHNFSMIQDESGTLWAMSFTGFLYYLDPVEDRFIECPLDTRINSVAGFIPIGSGRYWVTAGNGIFELSLKKGGNLEYCRQVKSPENVSCGLLIGQNDFFAGTRNGGLFHIKLDEREKGWEKIEILPFEEVVAVANDKNNGIWVSSSDNIALLTPSFFKTYPFDLLEVYVQAIQLLPDSSLLASSGEEVFRLVNIGNEWRKRTFYTSESVVTSFFKTGDSLWMGNVSGELSCLDLNTKVLSPIPELLSTTTSITDILQDRAGNLWVAGNQNAGLVRISPQGEHFFYKREGLEKSRVIYESATGIIFVGGGEAAHYLFLYNPVKDNFTDLSKPLPFKANSGFWVEAILQKQDGSLYLATSEGFLSYNVVPGRREEDQVKRIDLQKIPADESIKALTYDQNGTYWLSTSSGLVAYDGQSALLFDLSSGLPSNNLISRGLQLDHQGNLWVATAKGLGLFRKNNLTNNITPTPLITSLKVNENKRLIRKNEVLQVPYRSGFELSFQSFSFPVSRLKYQTRLPERDTNWSEPGGANYALLSGLASGDYTFQVRAQQQGGYLWSAPAELVFHIDRPWYQKWWAIFLLWTVFAGIVYSAARWYNRNLIRQNEKLEATIRERTEKINQQKNEIIEQQNQLIGQNEKFRLLEEEKLQQEIIHKNKQLTTHTLHLIQKNEALKELRQKIITSIRSGEKGKTSADLKAFLSLIDFSFHKDREWDNFQLFFEKVHVGFFENLKEQFPDITPLEMRHCALIRLNLSIQETATILAISPESVKTSRFRIRRKMNLESQSELVDVIMKV